MLTLTRGGLKSVTTPLLQYRSLPIFHPSLSIHILCLSKLTLHHQVHEKVKEVLRQTMKHSTCITYKQNKNLKHESVAQFGLRYIGMWAISCTYVCMFIGTYIPFHKPWRKKKQFDLNNCTQYAVVFVNSKTAVIVGIHFTFHLTVSSISWRLLGPPTEPFPTVKKKKRKTGHIKKHMIRSRIFINLTYRLQQFKENLDHISGTFERHQTFHITGTYKLYMTSEKEFILPIFIFSFDGLSVTFMATYEVVITLLHDNLHS